MRRACVSSNSRMICSSRRVLYCLLLVLAGFGAVVRRVSVLEAVAAAAGSGDSPGSDAARRLRDCLDALAGGPETVLLSPIVVVGQRG